MKDPIEQGLAIHADFAALEQRVLNASTWIDYDEDGVSPAGMKPNGKKPWQKGFIPTVGKQPALPTPQLGAGWGLIRRQGNEVTYEPRQSTPYYFSEIQIVGDLVKRKWSVRKANVFHDEWSYTAVFTSTKHEACVVWVALEGEPTTATPLKTFATYWEADVLITDRQVASNTRRKVSWTANPQGRWIQR